MVSEMSDILAGRESAAAEALARRQAVESAPAAVGRRDPRNPEPLGGGDEDGIDQTGPMFGGLAWQLTASPPTVKESAGHPPRRLEIPWTVSSRTSASPDQPPSRRASAKPAPAR